ncbi:MAG: Cu(I)-responsive transcriptional regulator [Alphaproteobacteria bacterium]|nr:Cu(I)-responsive transcriptional regulator [Alphaproteobacteria bacterium]
MDARAPFLDIGKAARATGVPAKTIRYYESVGLIEPARRAENGYRLYGENQIATLRFVRRARDLGFSIKAVADLLALWRDRGRASADVKALALDHARELDRRIAELKSMREIITVLAERCHGDDRPDCPILDTMARPHGKKTARRDTRRNGRRR